MVCYDNFHYKSNNFDSYQRGHFESNKNLRSFRDPIVKLFAMQRVGFLRKKLNGFVAGDILEVGCGDGFASYYMRDFGNRYFACDLSEKMLKSNPLDVESLFRADVYQLPHKEDRFDLVFSWELLHHLANPEKAIEEMARVSKKYLVFFEPNALNPAMFAFGLVNRVERGLHRFTSSYLKKLAKSSDLKIEFLSDVGMFTPNRSFFPWALLSARMPFVLPRLGLYSLLIARKGGWHS